MDVVRGESPQGDWTYVSWRPPELADVVDHLWAYSGPTTHPLKRVFPNGCIELILNLSAPYEHVLPQGSQRLPQASLTGTLSGPLLLRQPARQHCIAARLRPAGAYALIPQPLHELAGHCVELHDVVGHEASALVERCAALSDPAMQLQLLAAWLRRRMRFVRTLAPAVAWAMAELETSGGARSIAELRERTGLSKARLSLAFREAVGLTPKLYGRVLRFHRALSSLQAHGDQALASVALESHFYDQPHMNAEFRALGGLTPREFVATRHPVGDGSTAAG